MGKGLLFIYDPLNWGDLLNSFVWIWIWDDLVEFPFVEFPLLGFSNWGMDIVVEAVFQCLNGKNWYCYSSFIILLDPSVHYIGFCWACFIE